jgi:hypothetical protein
VAALAPGPEVSRTVIYRPSPNVPVIGADGAVADAVVYLRGVSPSSSSGWNRPPVTIELHDERPMIRQGNLPPSNIGFVRSGDDITIVSGQPVFHSLRARGAAFWTVSLPDADRPRVRKLVEPGVIELSSGANYFWMRGYIWVCEHPYYTQTNAAGQWSLGGMPAGEYDLVVWLPDWRTVRQERDPETGFVARYIFRPPIEVVRRVKIENDQSVTVSDIRITP